MLKEKNTGLFYGKLRTSESRNLLIIDLDDTLMFKHKAEFKYDIIKIKWANYRVVVVSNQTHYLPKNKTFEIVNKKIELLQFLTAPVEFYIAQGTRYRKPATAIIELIVDEECEKIHCVYPELAETGVIISDEPIDCDLQCKFIEKYIYAKKPIFDSILIVGDQAGRKGDHGSDDINLYKNFNIIRPYLEDLHFCQLPRAEFRTPEEFFQNSEKKFTLPRVFNFAEIFREFDTEYKIQKSPTPEILYITGATKIGKSHLALFIREKWKYALQFKLPLSEELMKCVNSENNELKKSYVIDMPISWIIPGKTRLLVIEPEFSEDEELYQLFRRHLILADAYLRNQSIPKSEVENLISQQIIPNNLNGVKVEIVNYVPSQFIENGIRKKVLSDYEKYLYKQLR